MNDERMKVFLDFIKTTHILVIDKSSASRRRLVKTFVNFGARRDKIYSVGHIEEAKQIIQENKPRLVISDFHINGGSGFDLFRMYKENFSEIDSIHILVTSNISQAAVAKAAEEDVDAFIIKPYNVKSLEKNLVTTVFNKLSPSEYMQVIEEGKKEMFAGEYESALNLFEKAIDLSPKSSLAYFYHGQAKYFLELNKEAKTDYKKGLSLNNIHYKCQIGLYEIFLKEKQFEEAYEIVRNIVKYFPANPNRLVEIVRLAVMTKNYIHMEDYYEIFRELEERSEEVINHICSGLYILGKYYFLENSLEKGKETFEKVAVSCQGKTKLLRAIIAVLVEYNLTLEAEGVLKRFPAGSLNEEDYMVSSYLVNEKKISNTDKINLALGLVNSNFLDPKVFKSLIWALKEENYKDKVEEYEVMAQEKWPDYFFGVKKKVA